MALDTKIALKVKKLNIFKVEQCAGVLVCTRAHCPGSTLTCRHLPSTLQEGLENVQPRSQAPAHSQVTGRGCTCLIPIALLPWVLLQQDAGCPVSFKLYFKEFFDPCELWHLHPVAGSTFPSFTEHLCQCHFSLLRICF